MDAADRNEEDYELLLPQQNAYGDTTRKPVDEALAEGRSGDSAGLYIAFAGIGLMATTSWVITLVNDPFSVGIFALHPILQTLGLVLLVYGVMTLQPTSQPKTKAAGLERHQYAMALVALPALLVGASAVWYNKERSGRAHYQSLHAKLGTAAVTWLVVQLLVGGASVWFGGAAFGGGMKAKSVWKYHRASGYALFVLLMVTAHLGGFWSHWGERYSPLGMRIVAFAVAPLAALVGVYMRVRPSKMKFF
uniref:Cytochrome b561 domain-containing protein n=1 Tax=Mycena chlorophos TaxID=658473 RepID=A0ABQ0M860_MYCCL|nr:predicted protein [Mycena chlorophos]